VSVPYVSPLRRLSVLWRDDRRLVSEARAEARVERRSFWQYAFGVQEFSSVLDQAGFRVERTFPYAILFGLYDLHLLPRLLERKPEAERPTPSATASPPAPPGARRSGPAVSLVKRLVVSEDRSVTGLGPLVELAGRFCANMMMYVCTR
jgi:hypothetical protein